MIYMDNAATKLVSENVLNKTISVADMNPSAIYNGAENARFFIDETRKMLSEEISAYPDEIYFTSGGTESNNWVLQSIMLNGDKKHLITSKIEHPSILNTCKYLESKGIKVTYLDVDFEGNVDLNQLENSITDNTALVSIMFTNNEIGTIQPIKEIGKICKRYGVLFHTDAVQAFGHEPINVEDMNIDLLSVSGHKFGAFKGTGFLYIRRGIDIKPLIYGGEQENGMRSGTYNIHGIASMGFALDEIRQNYNPAKSYNITSHIINRILKEIPSVICVSPTRNRAINICSFCFKDIDGQVISIMLGEKDICVSSGSACASASRKPSHVLEAMGLSEPYIKGLIRISLNDKNTLEEADKLVDSIIETVNLLRG